MCIGMCMAQDGENPTQPILNKTAATKAKKTTKGASHHNYEWQ